MTGPIDRTKTLQDLEQHNWGDPAPTDSSLVTKCMQLRRKPLAEFTTEDLRVMVGQRIGLPYLVVVAVDVLESNPLAEGDFYPGDLLCAVLGVDEEFWGNQPDSVPRMQRVVKQARTMLAASSDETDRVVLREIEAAPHFLLSTVSPLEEELCRRLRSLVQELPDGAEIPPSPAFREMLNDLECYLPDVILEIHPEFDYCFDGIEPRMARKLGESTMEVRGMVWLLDEGCLLTPLHVRLQIAPDEDQICWLECRVGKRSREGSTGSIRRRLDSLAAQDAEAIEWACEVGFGERR